MRTGSVRKPAQQEPGVEGRQLAAEIGIDLGSDLADELGSTRDDACHHVPVAADIFRGGMDDEVDAESERLLEDRALPSCCR